jgi:signal peptidase I
VGVLKTMLSLAMWVAAIALTAGAVLKLFFVDVIVLGHDAMAPTIALGEQVFLWRDAEPKFADVVVCAHPRRPSELVVGRVLGRPGHLVRTTRGQLTVSGDSVEHDIVGRVDYSVTTAGRLAPVRHVVETAAGKHYDTFFPEDLTLEIRPTEVAEGRLYLLSDHRAYHGYDSRSFGTVDRATCRGTVFMLWKPTPQSAAALGHGYMRFID